MKFKEYLETIIIIVIELAIAVITGIVLYNTTI